MFKKTDIIEDIISNNYLFDNVDLKYKKAYDLYNKKYIRFKNIDHSIEFIKIEKIKLEMIIKKYEDIIATYSGFTIPLFILVLSFEFLFMQWIIERTPIKAFIIGTFFLIASLLLILMTEKLIAYFNNIISSANLCMRAIEDIEKECIK